MPITYRCRREVRAASFVMEMELVLVARITSGRSDAIQIGKSALLISNLSSRGLDREIHASRAPRDRSLPSP